MGEWWWAAVVGSCPDETVDVTVESAVLAPLSNVSSHITDHSAWTRVTQDWAFGALASHGR